MNCNAYPRGSRAAYIGQEAGYTSHRSPCLSQSFRSTPIHAHMETPQSLSDCSKFVGTIIGEDRDFFFQRIKGKAQIETNHRKKNHRDIYISFIGKELLNCDLIPRVRARIVLKSPNHTGSNSNELNR